MPDPRVSILIPNYNNGRASSRDGGHDLIARLLDSLERTLANDPTPLEIIAYDDGSTDDSLHTLRQWADKTWRDGQTFLELMVAPHCGVLSKTANVLVKKSRGDILVRLDGDVECLTDRWAQKLCAVFDQGPPRLGVVGPKQLGSDGRIHAFGDMILHPRGYHHLGAGLDRYAVQHAVEVDHVMGCFYCCRRSVYEQVGGYDESMLRGQTIDFGLAARLHGWSAIAVPHIEFAHHHGLRSVRTTRADSDDGVDQTLNYFQDKWGFCRIAPDLDAVRRKYAGTPLLWNAAVFAAPSGAAEPVADALRTEDTAWSRYADDPAYQHQLNLRLGAVVEVLKQLAPDPSVVILGAGTGLIPHMLATRGLTVLGVEANRRKAALARGVLSRHAYPGPPPRIVDQPDLGRVPLDDRSADMVLIADQLETHPNPARLLAEAGRIVTAEGRLVVTATQCVNAGPRAMGVERAYRVPELVGQMMRAAQCEVLNDVTPRSPDQPLIAVARPRATTGAADAAPEPAAAASAA